MDCTGLCKNFTIEDCTELQQDCLDCLRIVTDLWPCNRHFNPTNPFTIDKILTKSNFLINVNVVQLRDFSGSSYAHFPSVWEGVWDSEKNCLAWPNKENMSKMHDLGIYGVIWGDLGTF